MALQGAPGLGGPGGPALGGAPGAGGPAGGFLPAQWFQPPPFGQQPFGQALGQPFGQLPFGQQPFGQQPFGLPFGQPAEQPKGEHSPNFIKDWIHGLFGQHNHGNPLPNLGQPQPPFLPFIGQAPPSAIDKALIPENLKLDKKDR